MKIFTCKYCNKDFSTTSKRPANYCGNRCRNSAKLEEQFIGKKEGYDYIVCSACGQKMRQMNVRHAKLHGFSSASEFAKHHNVPITCQAICDNTKGENNPAYNHGGKYSKWSKNFIYGYDADAHKTFAKNHSLRRNDSAQKYKYKNNIEYWVKQCDGAIEKAKIAYTNYQKRDLVFFIKKYGEEEGQKRHLQKIEKWSTSFKKCNFSKISQELFDGIMRHLDDKSDIYYATFDRADKIEYKNKEYLLKIENTVLRPDFIDVSKKKIIEFDGDYWHSETKANPIREQHRDKIIKNNGYQILHIAEHEYRKNKTEVIDKCLTFLTK